MRKITRTLGLVAYGAAAVTAITAVRVVTWRPARSR